MRSWYSPSELNHERSAKGFSGSLSADLARSEARLDSHRDSDGSPLPSTVDDAESLTDDTIDQSQARTRLSDLDKWKSIMQRNFIAGRDKDFDYTLVDSNDLYDDSAEAEMDHQDCYFDQEEAEHIPAEQLHMETGKQDF